jgi:hypothetical protein
MIYNNCSIGDFNMAGYSKEFLVSAFLDRYVSLDTEKFTALEEMADKFYDDVGRDKFRVYCSLDADAIKKYKENL